MSLNFDFNEEEKNVMPYVRFSQVAEKDVVASKEKGYYVARDADYIHLTQPGSRDTYTQRIDRFFEQCEQQININRMPPDWYEKYKKMYGMWKKGQEIPEDGTPIKGWALISPAQQETLVRMGVTTVEVLSKLNADGLRRIGIGGEQLKAKAKSWLKSAKEAGKVASENAELIKEVERLKAEIETLKQELANDSVRDN